MLDLFKYGGRPDLRYLVYRIYTSDVPYKSINYRPTEDSGAYPYLQELIPNPARGQTFQSFFVTRQPVSTYNFEPVHVYEDVLSCIISFGPAMWYTVSKSCREIAKQHILNSDHIRKQWNDGAIFIKANYENNPEMLTIFLDAEWSLSERVLRNVSKKSTVVKLLQYPHIIDLINKYNMALDCLRYAPDEVIQHIENTKYCSTKEGPYGREQFAYDCLSRKHRPDLIDKLYSRHELSPNIRAYMNILDYVNEICDTLDSSYIGHEASVYDILSDVFETIQKDSQCMDRFLEVCEMMIQYEVECECLLWCIRANYIQGSQRYLEKYPDLIREECHRILETYDHVRVYGGMSKEMWQLLRGYLLNKTDYSQIYEHLWGFIDKDIVDLFIHFLKCGYAVKPRESLMDKIQSFESEELNDLIDKL